MLMYTSMYIFTPSMPLAIHHQEGGLEEAAGENTVKTNGQLCAMKKDWNHRKLISPQNDIFTLFSRQIVGH